jgi:glycosyltransferase involved in cell wall biosynthesis
VSVIIPVFNVEDFIADTLASVLAQQGMLDFEVLLVDDRSTDNTVATARRIAASDPRVTFLQNTGKRGAAGARNFGLRHARGTWVAFLDGDDLWEPDNLALKMQAARAWPNEQIISSDFFNENSCNRSVPRDEWPSIVQSLKPAWHKNLPPAPASGNPVSRVYPLTARFIEDDVLGNTGVFVIRRAAIMSLGGFDETLEVGEDVYLWIQLAERTGSMLFVHRPLMLYRYRPGSLTNQGYPAHAFFAEKFFGALATKPQFSKYLPLIRARLNRALKQQCYYFRQTRQQRNAITAIVKALRFRPLDSESWRSLIASMVLR